MQDTKKITFFSIRKKVELDSNSILYIMMKRDKATIHASGNRIYDTWISLCDREPDREPEVMELVNRHILQFFRVYQK